MPGYFFERHFPGATTCVVVGPLARDQTPAEFASARAIVWCDETADPNDGASAVAVPAGCVVHHVPLARARHDWLPALEKLVQRDARHLPSVFVTEQIVGPHTDHYLALLADLQATLDRHHRARETRQKDGFTWQRHLLANLPAYVSRRVPAAWAGALRGVPAFICGAGPSLDVTAPLLAAHRNRGLVFAADSALRGLARHGVTADFAVSLDAAKLPEKCLPPDRPPAHVILTSVSPPAWTAALPPERTHFLSCRQLTLDWLAARGIPRTPLTAASNCGHTALEFAHFLGCAPLYLFGLDLAVSSQNPAQRHHAAADASLYTHSGFDAAAPLPTVPGNYEERVPTFAPDDWRALDERLASFPAGLVGNVTDRGARFRGATLIAPADFVPPVGETDTAAALARLDHASPATASAARSADDPLALLAHLGRHAAGSVPALRQALRSGGPDAVVAHFRRLLADQDTGRVFGAFSLKLMPHLLPPVSANASFWSNAIAEFATLADLAARASVSARKS